MIEHNRPTISEDEFNSLLIPINKSWLAEGEEVAFFERDFCALYGLEEGHAVAVSSGSAALYLALLALESKNKTVAIPVYSCASLENAVLLARGKPYYVDCTPSGFNMNQADSVNADIVIHPHMFGIPSVINKDIQSKTIEDCAQSIGARVKGKLVGLQAELGIFSFYATKLITSSGQGGMIISKNKQYIDYIKDFIHFDCKNDGKLRFNFLMTDIQASMGRVQLRKLFEDFIPIRENIFQTYLKANLPVYQPENINISPVRFRTLLKTKSPYKLSKFLFEQGIKTIIPIEESELLGGKDQVNGSTIKNCNSLLSIPCYPSLLDEEVQYIIANLKKAKHLI